MSVADVPGWRVRVPLRRIARTLRATLVVASLVTSLVASAAALAERERTVPPFLEDGGDFEIGLIVGAALPSGARRAADDEDEVVGSVDLLLGGAWRRGSLFVEGRHGGFAGASAGVTLWHDDRSVLELLALHVSSDVRIDLDEDEGDAGRDTGADRRLLERETFFGSSGLRLRHYRGAALAQLSLVVDWEHGNGVLGGLHVGRQWQLGNWNTHAIVGVRHASSRLADFVWGVDADEASERFAAYRAPAATFGELELGLSRPLAARWVFHSTLRARRFGEAVTDSPLVVRDSMLAVEGGVSYVF